MKRILRKGNPIARLVALWVVFVMVLVPLLENAGPLKKVKAADPVTAKFTLELDMSKFVNTVNENDNVAFSDTEGYSITGKNTVLGLWSNHCTNQRNDNREFEVWY